MPRAVSVVTLTKAIDKAVAVAAERHKITVERETIQHKWEIIGRVVPTGTDLNVAFRFATDVTKSLKIEGLKPDPVAVRLDKKILVGFIDRGALPRLLSGG
jgi:hypothetical protein